MQEATRNFILQVLENDPETTEAEKREIGNALQKRRSIISGKGDSITSRQAADILGVSVFTVRKFEERGLIHGRRLSPRHLRYSRSEVEELARSGV